MVAGHLREKNGYYYAVLNYNDAFGKRKTKWIATGLTVKGNKKKAEAFLMEERQKLQPEEPVEGDIFFADYMEQWLDVVKSSIAVATYASYAASVKRIIAPYFRERRITLKELTAKDIQDFYLFKLKSVSASSVIHYHANIHKALYYSKNTANNHEGFVTAVFNTELPMPAQEQKETFNTLLAETVAEDCSYDVVETVHAELSSIIDTHKENREEEPLVIGKSTVTDIHKSCGVAEPKLEDFEEKYDEAFGENTQLSPGNIIDRKSFQLKTPDVVVKVDPEKLDVVETRVIDGTKYILIRADNDVEVNGVNIKIKK